MNTILRSHRVTVTIGSCCAGRLGAGSELPPRKRTPRPSRFASPIWQAAQDVGDLSLLRLTGLRLPHSRPRGRRHPRPGIVGTSNAAVRPSSTVVRACPCRVRRRTGDPATQVSEVGLADGDGARDVLQVGGGLAGVLLLIWVLRTLIRKSSAIRCGPGPSRPCPGAGGRGFHSWLGIRWPAANMWSCSKWGDASWWSIRPRGR